MWGSIFSVLGNIGSTILSGIFNRKGNREGAQLSLENNEKLMDKSQNLWKEQFGLQNERQDWLMNNSIQAEVNDMRRAGINPFWSQNPGSSVSQVSSPSAPIGQSGLSNIYGNISPIDFANLGLIDAQMKNVQADTQGKEIENFNKQRHLDDEHELALSEKNYKSALVEIGLQQMFNDTQRLAYEYSLTDAKIKEIESNIEKNNSEIEQINAKIDEVYGNLEIAFDKLPYELRVLSASATEQMTRAGLNNAQIREVQASIYKIGAETFAIGHQMKLNDVQIDKILAEIGKLKSDAKYAEIKAKIAEIVGEFVDDNKGLLELSTMLYGANKTGLLKYGKDGFKFLRSLKKNPKKTIERVRHNKYQGSNGDIIHEAVKVTYTE